MASSILEKSEEFIRSVEERFRELNRVLIEQGMGPLTERNGKPITSLRPSELLAFHTLTAQMAQQKDKPDYEIAIELEEDARKSVFIFFVLLPIFRAITSGSMIYVAVDDMHGPKLQCMNYFIRDQVEFVELGPEQAVPVRSGEGWGSVQGRGIRIKRNPSSQERATPRRLPRAWAHRPQMSPGLSTGRSSRPSGMSPTGPRRMVQAEASVPSRMVMAPPWM